MATRANNTVVAFPPRGGGGFSIAPQTKLRALDTTNLCLLNMVRGAKEDGARRDALLDAAAPRSPELLLAVLMFSKLDIGTKEFISQQVQQLCDRNDESAEQLRYWVEGAK